MLVPSVIGRTTVKKMKIIQVGTSGLWLQKSHEPTEGCRKICFRKTLVSGPIGQDFCHELCIKSL